MRIRELIRYSKLLLKGRRARTVMILMLPLGAELLFRFAEAAIYSLLLYFGEMSPISLFTGESRIQLAAALLCALFRLAVTAPLIYAASFRLCEICCEAPRKRITPIPRVLMNRRCFKRSLAAALWSRFFSFIALIPAIFFGLTTYSLITDDLDTKGVFMAVHAFSLTVASVILWISLKISLAALPYLLVKFPQKGVFRTAVYALRLMSGRKAAVLRLAAVYFFPMLTVIGIPFAYTGFMTSFYLSIEIFIKEDEYLEGNKADGRIGQADVPASLPLRKKRRFSPAADTTEASGKRNNAKRSAASQHRHGFLRRRNNTEDYGRKLS